MGEADATMDFLETLGDESKWVIDRGVPIFKPHKRTDPKTGETLYEVTAEDMPIIAANMASLQQVGVFPRITPGHVLPQNTETQQPALYGVGVNPRAGTFGPKNEPCVLVDRYLFPKHADAAKNFPFRSVEYYHGAKVIRGIALLIREPYLDMGMVTTYAAKHGAFYSYEAEPKVEPNEPKPGEGTPTPEEEKAIEGHMSKYKKWMCQKYGLAEAQKPGEGKPGDMPEAIKLQLDCAAQMYSQSQANVVQLTTEFKKLRDERDAEKCKRLIGELVAEGYQLDPKEEELALLSLDDAGRTKAVERIQKNYRKADRPPLGNTMIPYAKGPGSGAPGAGADRQTKLVEEATLYCASHGGANFLIELERLDKEWTTAGK